MDGRYCPICDERMELSHDNVTYICYACEITLPRLTTPRRYARVRRGRPGERFSRFRSRAVVKG